MRFIKTIALAAILATGAGTAYASPFDSNFSIQALDDARYATVLTVNPGEAKALAGDNDAVALQKRIMNNKALLRAVESQGFSIDQIVGLDSTPDSVSVTLYAL